MLWEIRKTRSDGVLDAHARTPAGCVLPGDPRIPQVKGMRIHATEVNKDGTVSHVAEPSKTLTLGGCSNWQPVRYCPIDQIAVGVKAYFTAAGGFTGLALQCKALDAR